jgi:hypothetical protein
MVEHSDVIEDIGTRQVARFVNALLDAFLFQAAEERFGNGIIPAVAASTHARLQMMCATETKPVVAAVLRSLIRMDDHRFSWLASPHGHQKRIHDQFLGKPCHGVANGEAGLPQLSKC